jgi:3D (Asp-Asp-Asp) domain-containing protein
LDKGNYVFVRPADLIEADKVAAQQAQSSGGGLGGGLIEESGTISGQNYVAKIPGAVVTAYTDLGAGASGLGCAYNSTCASHNLPYGTKIFIPGLVGQAGQGIYTITDTGGPLFDFDICTSSWAGKTNMDAYVLEWGTGKVAGSYTYFIDYYLERNTWSTYVDAWNTYKNMGGKLIGCTKFSQDDANITSHPHYND